MARSTLACGNQGAGGQVEQMLLSLEGRVLRIHSSSTQEYEELSPPRERIALDGDPAAQLRDWTQEWFAELGTGIASGNGEADPDTVHGLENIMEEGDVVVRSLGG